MDSQQRTFIQDAENIANKARFVAANSEIIVPLLIVICFILFLLIIIFVFIGIDEKTNPGILTQGPSVTGSANQLRITKTGPSVVANDGTITYTINTTYPGNGTVLITDVTFPCASLVVVGLFEALM